ncbi:MAG: peptidylprolyl isomerase [Proteobacteria bacterium]|nr:peptidylprolyl isomerase [Pseudomonadota bacterium]
MRWTYYAASFALTAALAGSAVAQAPAPAAAGPAATGPVAPQPAPKLAPLQEGVVATVNDQIISSYDLRQRLLLEIAMSGVKATPENIQELEQEAMRALVDERLQAAELKRYEVKVADSEVDDEVATIAKENNMTKDQLYAGLSRAGVEPATLREELRNRIAWQDLVGGRFRDHARVGADEVQQTLARITAAASKPQYLVGEIYIDANRVGGMDQALNGANQLVDQIVKGAPFQAVARQFSSAPSAATGGDAGWLLSGEINPDVQAALEHMHTGQLSKPIPTKDGVWIVYLREQRTGGGANMVSLKQAAIRLPADAPQDQVSTAEKTLASLQGKLTCDNIEKVDSAGGVIGADLGESSVTELAPEFQKPATELKVGQVSSPIRTSMGLHLIAVCNKRMVGADIPTKEQVESKLFGNQIGMLERRWMRDLRSAATIEMRN